MRSLSELLAEPDSPLTQEEYDNFDAILFSGRTDGLPYEAFEYDPDTGEELPSCSRWPCVVEASKVDKPYEMRRRAADIRWRLFQQRCRASIPVIMAQHGWPL